MIRGLVSIRNTIELNRIYVFENLQNKCKKKWLVSV